MPPAPTEPPEGRMTLGRTAGALAIAATIAFLLDPGLPARWARDAVLPEGITLALIDAADAWEAQATALGLDTVRRWGDAAVGALRPEPF